MEPARGIYFAKWVDMMLYTFLLVVAVFIIVSALAGGKNAFVLVLPKRGALVATGALVIASVVAVGVFAVRRDYFLPFLGDTVMPCSLLGEERAPEGADTSVRVDVGRPGATVAYWAAEHNGEGVNPWVAYREYSNAGVAKADADGWATLRVRRPVAYATPGVFSPQLPEHVHYRVCSAVPGMMERVETVPVMT